MTCSETQHAIYGLLQQIFGPDLVKTEWSVRTGAVDLLVDRAIYAPRLDIAVGPFNPTRADADTDVERIYAAADNPLVRRIIALIQESGGEFQPNRNPRCLLAGCRVP